MPSVCFYFQVHQPHRLRPYSYFDIGQSTHYFDDEQNRAIVTKVAEKCYLPANKLLLELIQAHNGAFKVAFSLSGTAIEQFQRYCPNVLESFRQLVSTGCVELLSETYNHSLSAVFSPATFIREIQRHRALIQAEFDYNPLTFRNSELIYNNQIGEIAASLGYHTILAEGADKILRGRSPNVLYSTPSTPNINLLLKNYALSDDIAFRFSNTNWSEYPLTADKFASWLPQLQNAEVVNLFMDYETFGEHQWGTTGIFEFMRHLPKKILTLTTYDFCLPHETTIRYAPRETLDSPDFYSWADSERDLSAWLGNAMQQEALQQIYSLEAQVIASQNETINQTWEALLTSDHFYYMCTKQDADGAVHQYFSHYESPYAAFVNYKNVVNDFTRRILLSKN